MATSLNDLAAIYHDQRQFVKAERFYKRALVIREKALGPKHPDLATSLEHYAFLLRKMHRRNKAALLEARARSIRGKRRLTDS